NGGFGSLGSGPGPNYGVTFDSNALAVIAIAAGGIGNFANAPGGGDTIAFFLTGPRDDMNVAADFTKGIFFDYASDGDSRTVTVWSGLRDKELDWFSLAAFADCKKERGSIHDYWNWSKEGATFAETANHFGCHDIHPGSATPS